MKALPKLPARAAVVAGLVALPLATAWVVGDQSSPGFAEYELDYIYRPFEFSPALGWASVAIVLASGILSALAFRQGVLRRAWLPVVLMLAGLGVVLGYGFRVVTAGVIGANIGGAMLLLFGLPVLAVYVVVIIVKSIFVYRKLHRS
jgi:hypothetical protein